MAVSFPMICKNIVWCAPSLKCVKINTKEENPIQRKAGKTTLF